MRGSTVRLAAASAFAGDRLPLLIVGLLAALLSVPSWSLATPLEMAIAEPAIDRVVVAVGIWAALLDPIDWLRPLFLNNIHYPEGTTLLLVDGVPLVSLPMRAVAEMTGILVDPAIAMAFVSFFFCTIGPLSIARLARALGSSGLAPLASGVIVTLSIPFIRYLVHGWAGLPAWPLLALLMAELVLIEREGYARTRVLRIAALLSVSIWTYAYYAAIAVGLILLSALGQLRGGRSRAALSVLLSALLPLIPLVLFGNTTGQIDRSVLGTVGANDGSFGIGAGLVRSDLLSTLTGGEIREQGYVHEWGLLFTLIVLVALPRIVRIGFLGWGVVALALFSLGSSKYEGLLPPELYANLPIANLFFSIDRFFIPIALLGAAIAPQVMIGLGGGARRLLAPALLITLLAGEVWASLVATGWIRANAEPPPTLPIASAALAELIDAHELVRVEPRLLCMTNIPEEDDARRFGRALLVRTAFWAVEGGGVSDGFVPPRFGPRPCLATGDGSDEPGALVIQYGGPGVIERGEIRRLSALMRCAATDSSTLFGGEQPRPIPVRFCSMQHEPIERFVARTGALQVSPLD